MNSDAMNPMFWPPNGFLFKEISLAPAYCKPKLIPLKSVTLEKLERMQADALEKLKEIEEEQKRQVEEEANEQRRLSERSSEQAKRTDIWEAGQSTD
ncbi:BBSome-interacting protein 1 [Aphelenchoides besseyi]|nr:BBSome-interacting protein 1 [Aphelenchoides besseyi]KAI6216601.1 BBSome-interacting protein 1 [Aphelenchoides besseyi]